MRRITLLAVLALAGCSRPAEPAARIAPPRAEVAIPEPPPVVDLPEPEPEPPPVAVDDPEMPPPPLRYHPPAKRRPTVKSEEPDEFRSSAERTKAVRGPERGVVGEARYVTPWQAGTMRLPLTEGSPVATIPPFAAVEGPIRLEKGARVRVRHVHDAAGADVWLVEGPKGKAAAMDRVSLAKYVLRTPEASRR